MAEQIRVLLVEPGEHPRLVTVEHTLENLQELVGGTIQAVYPFPEPVAVICDDDGKFKGYVPNRALVDEEGEPYDIVVGTFFICGLGKDNFASISDELDEAIDMAAAKATDSVAGKLEQIRSEIQQLEI